MASMTAAAELHDTFRLPSGLLSQQVENVQPKALNPENSEHREQRDVQPANDAPDALHAAVEQLQQEDAEKTAERLLAIRRKLFGGDAGLLRRNVATEIPQSVIHDARLIIQLQRSQNAGGIQEEQDPASLKKIPKPTRIQSGFASGVNTRQFAPDSRRVSTERGSTGISLRELERQGRAEQLQRAQQERQALEDALPNLTDADIESGVRNISIAPEPAPSEEIRTPRTSTRARTRRALSSIAPPPPPAE